MVSPNKLLGDMSPCPPVSAPMRGVATGRPWASHVCKLKDANIQTSMGRRCDGPATGWPID